MATPASGCGARGRESPVEGADPARGRALVAAYGCAVCHQIPGIASRDSRVGPPLTGLAQRSYLAGRLPNTQENLLRWIQRPQEVDPGNAMPDMGVPDADARDLAAYLLTAC